MIVLSINGLLFSPFVLLVSIACVLIIATNLVIPKVLRNYTILRLSWLNLLLFILYLGISILLFGE